ncbi:MAG: prefoldin subunit alpha [Thermoproteota archaeon]|jgi:prefoldin alpha subunit|nr:prefoldin subunit alpha [Thermoproteota archaeon]MDQ5831288.1 prefoldin subunit alpha [Thermoproteota archaeon]MDQ5859967.1 prefoldin subunit alpha [Thermoproteota archaeon]MDQ5875400.1 prefoldin subunit alpha [Thermoproteota archaeon]
MSAASDQSRQQELAAMEQRINELVQQSRILEAYMNDIMTRQVTVSKLMEEAHLASNTIQNIHSESDVESLMPIGIGVYVKTTVPPIKKLLINLDAGVAIEKSREDALNYVETRIKEYEVAARQLEAQRQEITMRINQLQSQINQMIQAAQQPG